MTQPEPDGVQAEPASECHGHRRVGVVEGTWRIRRLTQEPHRLDQLLVGVGHRRVLLPAPVAVLDHHRVPAGDLDILSFRNAEDRAEPPIPKDRLRHCLGVAAFQLHGPQRCPLAAEAFGMGVHDPTDDGPASRLPVVLRHHGAVFREPLLARLPDLLGRLPAQRDHELPVDVGAGRQVLIQEPVTRRRRRMPIRGGQGCERPRQAEWLGGIAGHGAPSPSSSLRLSPLSRSNCWVRSRAVAR